MATLKQTTEIVSTKKTNLENIESFLVKSAANLGQALPAHMKPERINRIVLTMLKMSPKLQECTPVSVAAAVFQMAQLGLEPIDGQAYIIPYKNSKKIGEKWTSIMEAQFQIGYKGYVALFYRHLASATLSWDIVKENDPFDFDLGQGKLSHKKNLKSPRGEAYAYWVKAKLQNGGEIFGVMSKIEVLDHAKQHSKAFDKTKGDFFDNTPWKTDFDSMALKTVLIQLMKLLPKSVEIQRALAMDETTKSTIAADMTEVPDETNWDQNSIDVEAEITPEVPAEKTADSLPPTIDPKDYKDDGTGRLVHKKTGKPL